MSVEIKTAFIKPKRITTDLIADKIGEGKVPTRYQEAVYGHQPEHVFHYRPTWQPEYELFDARRTAIVMKDFDDLLDPRQYYYGTYVIERSKQREAQEKNFSVVEKRGLMDGIEEDLINVIAGAVIPYRHVEWGANNNNFFISGYGFGTPITSAACYQAMDRLGIAQYITRIGLILGANETTVLDKGKEAWLNDPMWQGLRKIVETSFVTKDWFELHLLQNFIIDGVFHPLLFQHLENDVVKKSGAAFAMLTEFFIDWYAESQRWTDSTLKVAASDSEENKQLLKSWLDKWQPQVIAAATPIAEFAFVERSDAVMDNIQAELAKRSGKIGIGA
jgi:phenol/toluene 2-monooxygenase (NADH) P1/A1